jgi:hypothetical protein
MSLLPFPMGMIALFARLSANCLVAARLMSNAPIHSTPEDHLSELDERFSKTSVCETALALVQVTTHLYKLASSAPTDYACPILGRSSRVPSVYQGVGEGFTKEERT